MTWYAIISALGSTRDTEGSQPYFLSKDSSLFHSHAGVLFEGAQTGGTAPPTQELPLSSRTATAETCLSLCNCGNQRGSFLGLFQTSLKRVRYESLRRVHCCHYVGDDRFYCLIRSGYRDEAEPGDLLISTLIQTTGPLNHESRHVL